MMLPETNKLQYGYSKSFSSHQPITDYFPKSAQYKVFYSITPYLSPFNVDICTSFQSKH